MKVIIIALLALLCFAAQKHECPEKMQIKCIDDIRAGEPVCEDVIKTGGKDISKVLRCLTYVQKAQADCLDCYCLIVESFGIQVKACQS